MKRPDLNLHTLTEEELAHLAKMGKKDAFGLLYERLFPSVYAWVRFKVPESDVEDVTQEVFIAILRSLHGFRGQSKFSTWVRTITNRKIVDYHRTKPVVFAENQEYKDVADLSQGNQVDIAKRQDDLASVQQALLKLPRNYQDILLMRFVDDMPFSEIARQNGQSLEATKSLFRRAVAALSEKMQEEDAHNA